MSLTTSGSGQSTNPLAPGGATAVYVGQADPQTQTNDFLIFPATANGTVSATSSLVLDPQAFTYSSALDPTGNIYVATIGTASGLGGSTVYVYPAGSTGAASPGRTITNNGLGLASFVFVTALATDSAGQLYVLDGGNCSISVFAATASGNVLPVRQISGPLTQLTTTPTGGVTAVALAVDQAGYVYASVEINTTWYVEVYSPTANGNVAPVRTIEVTNGGTASDISALAIDPNGNLYVAYEHSGSPWTITEFASGANGAATPIKVISSTTTNDSFVLDFQIDSVGNLYALVDTSSGEAVQSFGPSASGEATPATELIVTPGSDTSFGQLLVR